MRHKEKERERKKKGRDKVRKRKKEKKQRQREKDRDKELLDTCKAWVAQLVYNRIQFYFGSIYNDGIQTYILMP
jgi:hypothetical protein